MLSKRGWELPRNFIAPVNAGAFFNIGGLKMNIYGQEYGFKMTVGAALAVARMCPNGDLSRLEELVTGSEENALLVNVEIAAAMSKGYADAVRFETGRELPFLTKDMLLTLSPDVLADVITEAMENFQNDTATTVAVKMTKKQSKKITLNGSWLLFYGHQLHMSRRETINTTFGELLDMVSCLAIYNGADPDDRHELTLEEILTMR